MSLVSEILTSTYEIVRKEIARIVPVHRWATVTSVSPLRIRFDDQTQPLAATPGKLVGSLMVGDRVDVRHRSPGQPLITGIAGGGDTGWVPVIIQPGFAAAVDEDPEVRRIGGVVYVRGIFSNTGLTANGTFTVAELPPGFAPPMNYPLRAGTQSGATNGTIFFFATGLVQIRTGASLSNYYSTAAATWPIT